MGYALAAHVIGRRMAAQAQEWYFFLEQAGIYRSMRVVTVGAIFSNRLVLPKHRAALVGMTAVARVIDPYFFQEIGTCRAMRVVAVRAYDLAFTESGDGNIAG